MINEQAQGSSRTIRQAERVINEQVLGAYDEARKAIIADLDRLYSKVLADIDPADYYQYMIQRNRLEKLLSQVDADFVSWSQKAGAATLEANNLAVYNNYYSQQYVLTWFSSGPVGITFANMPQDLAKLVTTGNLANWESLSKSVRDKIEASFGSGKLYYPESGTLSATLIQNRRDDVLKINRAITNGLIRGQSLRDMSKGISDVIGYVNGRKSTGAMAKAKRVARTESIRSLNAGAYANSQQLLSQGLDIKKIWISTLDLRTRDSHQSLDGQIREIDEDFNAANGSGPYPGQMGAASENINCRCRTGDIIGDVPPTARRGRDPVTGKTEIFTWKSYEEWARGNGLKQLPSGRWS